jgi:arylsulfatase A-like enzyme
LDRAVSPLVTAFKARSERAGRPWLIIVTSDHGEMLGDHGFFRKCEPFEGSANVPLIMAGSPALKLASGQVCLQPVCLEDLLPTLCRMARVETPAVDGVDLLPVLRGKCIPVRPWLHFEHAPCYSKAQAFHAGTDGRFKYVWRPFDGRELLFDLSSDPQEEHNLAKKPAFQELLGKWRHRMIARLVDRPEGFSDGTRLIPGRRYPPVNEGTRRN